MIFHYNGQLSSRAISAYAAMKGGFEVVTRHLARELGARGITANTVAPVGIVTDIGGIIAALADRSSGIEYKRPP